MTWFTETLADQSWRAIPDEDGQAMIGYRAKREFVGPLATVPISITEEDDDGSDIYPADQEDLRRLNAILALPLIARLFQQILDDKLTLEQIRDKVEGICDAIEDTQDLKIGNFVIGIQ